MRRTFPDDRFTYGQAGAQWLAGVPTAGVVCIPPGMPVDLFTDLAGTVPADVLHADGSAVTLSSPLVVDSYSQLPLWLGPDDASDTLYAVVAGGVPWAVYARTDERLDAVEALTTGLGQADDTTALANPSAGVASFRRVVIPTLPNVGGELIKGNAADTVVKNLAEWQDGNGAAVGAMGSADGLAMNDRVRLHYSYLSLPTNWLDIYGYRSHNGLTEFAWAGPPGNMLSHTDACQEVFASTRLGSKGGWQIFGGSSSDVTSVTDSSLPTGLKHAVELTSHTTSMTALTASGVFAYPVTAGATYTALANIKAVATVRSPTVGMQWWDSGNSFISTTSGSGVATNTSGYTLISSGALTAPVGAAYGAPCIVWPTSVSGEKHRLGGVGVWAGTVTEWAPPFVGDPSGTWGQASAGAIWRRKSNPTDPEGRLYICTVGGAPAAQVWVPMGSPRLATATPAVLAVAGAVGSSALAARSDHAHGMTVPWTSYTPALTNITIGNGTIAAEYCVYGGVLKVNVVVTLGSTSSVTGAIGVDLPAGLTARTSIAQRVVAQCYDSSADTVYVGGAAVTGSQLNAIRTHGIAATATTAVPFTWATSDNLRLFGEIGLV